MRAGASTCPNRRRRAAQRTLRIAINGAATSTSLSTRDHDGIGARVRPARPKPRASIASARFSPRSSEPARRGDSSFARARMPSISIPRPRNASTRPNASRSSVGTSRVAKATARDERRAQPAAPSSRSWSSRSAYTANASPTAASRSAYSAADDSSSRVTVSSPITGTIGPCQNGCEPSFSIHGVSTKSATDENAIPPT